MQSAKALKRDQTSQWVAYRLSSLGDVALMSGVLLYWHEKHGLSFDVVTRPEYTDLFLNHPAVGAVEGVPAKSSASSALRIFRSLSARYAGHGLVDLHGTMRSKLLALLWKGPVLRYKKFSLQRRIFVRTHSPRIAEELNSLNVTQRYALALEDEAPEPAELRPRVFLTGEETAAAAGTLASAFKGWGENRKPAPVAIHPFATHARKAWPRANWLELIAWLERRKRDFFVVGQGEPLLPGDARDFTGRTGLRDLCALLSHAGVLVTGDSGPMHLAMAVNTPVLALFGPTTREWGFYPCGPKDVVLEKDLPCRPCSLHGGEACKNNGECLAGIKAEEVESCLLEYFGLNIDIA